MGPLARGTCPRVTVALIDSGPQALLRLCLPFGLSVGASPSGKNALPTLQRILGVPPTPASHKLHVAHVRFVSEPHTVCSHTV